METFERVNVETSKRVKVITHRGEPPARVVDDVAVPGSLARESAGVTGQHAGCPKALK